MWNPLRGCLFLYLYPYCRCDQNLLLDVDSVEGIIFIFIPIVVVIETF